MPRHRPHHGGNTLSEYSLLIGLVAIGCMGALVLLANNISNSFFGMVDGMNKDQGGHAMLANSSGSPGATGLPGGMVGVTAAPGTTQTPSLSLSGVPAGTGTAKNITASDGKVAYALSTTIDASQSLLALAQGISPGNSLYGMLKDASLKAFLLAGNEATYSQNMNGVTGLNAIAIKNITGAESLRDMWGQYYQLTQISQSLSANYINNPGASPQDKSVASQANAMITQSINTMWSNYSQLHDFTSGTVNGAANLDVAKLEADPAMGGHMLNTYSTTPEAQAAYAAMVQNAAPALLNSDAVKSNGAIQSSLQTGLTTTNMATGSN